MFQGAGHVLQGAARDQAFFSQKNPKLIQTFWEWGVYFKMEYFLNVLDIYCSHNGIFYKLE